MNSLVNDETDSNSNEITDSSPERPVSKYQKFPSDHLSWRIAATLRAQRL